MRAIGPGVYFDGVTSARHEVEIELLSDGLEIRLLRGRLLAIWPQAQVERLVAPEHILRLGLSRNPVLARLEISDPALSQAIVERVLVPEGAGGRAQRSGLRVAIWGVIAVIMLVLAAMFGLPALADRLAPLLPHAFERKLGNLVDAELRNMLDVRHAGRDFECGTAEVEKPGRQALDTLVGRLSEAAALPVPLRVAVIRRPEANAVAVPGGRIYVFEGAIGKAATPDEIAAAIAHEMGHIARRDGTRSILQGAGLTFLFGMLLGDFAGGGAVATAAAVVLRTSYSRDVESAADRYAVELMRRVGADPHALAGMLARLAADGSSAPQIFRAHPDVQERIKAITAMAAQTAGVPLAAADEWSALQRICAGRP